MQEEEYGDRTILALKGKYREILEERKPPGKEILAGGKKVPLYKEYLFGGKCSMLLPETLADMDARERVVKYRMRNRPPVIKTDRDGDATMAFSLLPLPDGEEPKGVRERLGCIRGSMAKVWKQNVFYDTGEAEAGGTVVAWMDFRACCLDGDLYGLLFLFRAAGGDVLGNFHCSFPLYGMWKPAVLKLLETVNVQEKEDGMRAAAVVLHEKDGRAEMGET